MANALRNFYELTPGPHAGPVLRLGGNSADTSCFNDHRSGCNYTITDAYEKRGNETKQRTKREKKKKKERKKGRKEQKRHVKEGKRFLNETESTN
jgi:hypothetical protein